jgi:uncharacterized membrane protein YhhN
MSDLLLFAVFFLAGLNWLAVSKYWSLLEYLTKPGTMIALMLWASNASDLFDPSTHPNQSINWFLIGILFSIGGDVFLMLPNERFIAGLISFFLAHIAYIIGLNPSLPPLNIVSLIIIILIIFTVRPIYRTIDTRLSEREMGSLRIPIRAYTLVISLMLYSALMTFVRPEWDPLPAILVGGGALLFFISDTLIAWDRFVQPLTNRDLKVMVSYHLGQIGLIAGSVIHFAG